MLLSRPIILTTAEARSVGESLITSLPLGGGRHLFSRAQLVMDDLEPRV
jgi:hypothetical protein